MRLGGKVLVALVALVVAAPTAIAADDPAGDPTGVECVAADGGACSDPGDALQDPPSTGGDNPDDSGSSDGSGDDRGDGASDSSGDGSGDGSGGSDPGTGDGDPTDIDLCSWEPWNCGGGPGPGECNAERIAKRIPCFIVDPPRCNPITPHGSKICLPYPTDPVCKVDPETGEQSCWTPPELCLTAKFASEAGAAAAGCLPPSCTVAEDGTVDCGDSYCPDCVVPYPPPPCDYAENAAGEVSCERPLPCFIDDEGNKVCAVYDFAPGESRGGDSGGDDGGLVGVCVMGVDSPCNGQPEPRKEKGEKGGKAKRGGKAGPKKGAPGKKRKATTPKSGGGSSGKGSTKKGGARAGKPDTKKPEKKSPGARNPKGQTPKKSGAKKPKKKSPGAKR